MTGEDLNETRPKHGKTNIKSCRSILSTGARYWDMSSNVLDSLCLWCVIFSPSDLSPRLVS